MHTLHWFAVEAPSKEEAFDLVQSRLSYDEGEKFVEWSDWHVVGGGRWSESQYEDSSDMVVGYDEPEKFNHAIERVKKNRIEEMNYFLSKMDTDKLKSDIVDYISNSGILPNEQRFDMNGYYFKKVGDMLIDSYIPESYFYDLVEYTAHLGYLQERLDNPEKATLQYLVPVDFHY